MNKEKIKKLESVALQLVGKFIFEEMSESETETFSIISITGIKISSDLSYLDIFVSSLKSPETLAHGLARHGYHIQKRLNKALGIRKIPKIRFRYDDSGEKAEEVTKQINKLKITNNE